MINLFNRITASTAMSKSSIVVVYATASSEEEADRIAADLLNNRLIACCNILPGVRSAYLWEGKLCKESEVLMVMKSRRSLIASIA
jgi:periplasmic divalent cation tolerance protein